MPTIFLSILLISGHNLRPKESFCIPGRKIMIFWNSLARCLQCAKCVRLAYLSSYKWNRAIPSMNDFRATQASRDHLLNWIAKAWTGLPKTFYPRKQLYQVSEGKYACSSTIRSCWAICGNSRFSNPYSWSLRMPQFRITKSNCFFYPNLLPSYIIRLSMIRSLN
jgi:hypothetical protein